MFNAEILCCARVQINIQTFRVEFFRSQVDHCRIFRSSFIGIYHWLGAYRTNALYHGHMFVRFNDLEDVFA